MIKRTISIYLHVHCLISALLPSLCVFSYESLLKIKPVILNQTACVHERVQNILMFFAPTSRTVSDDWFKAVAVLKTSFTIKQSEHLSQNWTLSSICDDPMNTCTFLNIAVYTLDFTETIKPQVNPVRTVIIQNKHYRCESLTKSYDYNLSP